MYDIVTEEEATSNKIAKLQVQKSTVERKDVWDVKWSEDNPNHFAIMEKTRMIICNGALAEDPIQTSACK